MKFLLVNPGFYIGNLHVAWYGLIMACSMALAVVLCYFFARKRGLKSSDLLACALYVLPLAVIGARVFYVLFNPNGITYSFADVFKIWEGGMSIWGGVIGGFIGVLLYSLIHKKNLLSICDVITPALILAQSTGRWGNFINQEAHGWQVFDPKFFGLPFTVEIGGEYFLATFLYEAVLNTIGFAVLVTLLYKCKNKGLVTAGYLMWYGVVRSVIETFRTDPMLIGGVKFSQLVSIISACIGLSLLIYVLVRDHKLKKQGKNPHQYLEDFEKNNPKQQKNNVFSRFLKKNNKKIENKEKTATTPPPLKAQENSTQNNEKENKK